MMEVYVRPARGGLMFGAYEPDPLDLDPRERPADFEIRDLPLDLRPLRRAMDGVHAELPLLERAHIVELRDGLPTMMPDGHFLIDRLPGVAGFHVASGCNVRGLRLALSSVAAPLGSRERRVEAVREESAGNEQPRRSRGRRVGGGSRIVRHERPRVSGESARVVR
jgi:hypothetical protein